MNTMRRRQTFLSPIEQEAPAELGPATPPTSADLALMLALGIRYEEGLYRYACVYYDNLHDAANFARLAGGRDP